MKANDRDSTFQVPLLRLLVEARSPLVSDSKTGLRIQIGTPQSDTPDTAMGSFLADGFSAVRRLYG